MNLISREKAGSLFLFLYTWLCSGFFLGTLTLLGPVRWLTSWGRESGWDQNIENWVVLGIILLLFVLSAAVARIILQFLENSKKTIFIAGILFCTMIGLVSFWIWLNPDWVIGDVGYERVANSPIAFGPYPTAEKFPGLKKDGFTAIVPLLHPTAVPFEAILLEQLKSNAKLAGLAVIHAPMVPWLSENEESLRAIYDLAKSQSGQYYVHCYLGKDRIQVVKNYLARRGIPVPELGRTLKRTIEKMRKLERGKIIRLSHNIYITPYPTPDEFFFTILRGKVKQVVCLLDPKDPDSRKLIEWERNELRKYAMPFIELPIALANRSQDALRAAHVVRTLSGLTVVHAYHTEKNPPQVEAFIQAYRSK